MCGVLGILTPAGRVPSVDDARVIAMRDTMAHRGPDGAGLWRRENLVLAHRRLEVVAPGPDGHQPMRSPCGRHALVYNGELYNHAELLDDLARAGVRPRTRSDTEAILAALAQWGEDALTRLRGMFALGWYDTHTRTLVLARDPLGIKPLYWWHRAGSGQSGEELVFASEVQAILAHPELTPRPDPVGVAGYLVTIRTTLGSRTLFEGVRALRPGAVLRVDASGPSLRLTQRRVEIEPAPGADAADGPAGPRDAGATLRAVIADSVRRHLVSDVPLGSMLSGGLDSTLIASLASRERRGSGRDGTLRTYASGAAGSTGEDDLTFARRAAGALGTSHAEAPVTRDLFGSRWGELVRRTGLPLSTPNEVAIHEVGRRMRADGVVVALSGEGADEVFAGYEAPLVQAARFVAQDAGADGAGLFQLRAHAWTAPELLPRLLAFDDATVRDALGELVQEYDETFRRCQAWADLALASEPAPARASAAHQQMLRRVNLQGLLLRLDSALMLASVEGRTPLADREVVALGEAMPMSARAEVDPGAGVATGTKLILRRAAQGLVPSDILARPKASFPLPFQGWIQDAVPGFAGSVAARGLLRGEAIAELGANPAALWNLAWPAMNLALWAERWWGSGVSSVEPKPGVASVVRTPLDARR